MKGIRKGVNEGEIKSLILNWSDSYLFAQFSKSGASDYTARAEEKWCQWCHKADKENGDAPRSHTTCEATEYHLKVDIQ